MIVPFCFNFFGLFFRYYKSNQKLTTHRRQNHQVPTNQVKVQKGQNLEQDSFTCQKVYHEGTMARLQNLLLLLLLVTPTILQIANPGNHTSDKDLRTF